jgi:hypothetical protein
VISQVVGEGRTDGTHAVPRVTSVNPGACKYKRRAEPWVGDLPPFEPKPLCVELVRHLPEYPSLSLEAVKPVFGPEEIVYTPVQSCESVSVSEKSRELIS